MLSLCIRLIFLLHFYSICCYADDTCPSERDQPLHDEAKLHKDLLCAYNVDNRPVTDHKKTVTVKLRVVLKYISFDSLEETFTLHSWMALTWKDEYLKWTPSNYGGIKEIQIESHEIWTPRLALFNADASLYQSDNIYTTCLLDSDGAVTCVPPVAHSGICRTSLRRWPYDTQNCTLFFGSWMHTGEQVNFTFYNNSPIVMDDYQNGPGWRLTNVLNERMPGKYSCCPNSTYPMLKYTFMLKREAAGPAAIVVVPSIAIVILTLTSLVLDIKDNTRLFMICFSLFGHFIFLTEIGYDIPKHSADTPIILLFVRDSMIVTLAGVVVTLVLMSVRRRVVPPPAWLAAANRLVTSGPGKYVVFTEFDPCDTTEVKTLSDDGNGSNLNEEKSRTASEWILFANLLNSVVFIVALIVYLVLIISYIPRDN
ncbi:neuronal acetylcholine receptor subunit alpha-10 [Papilio machaon]|uniref:neuronal acetylcholine receptor subunit alpha-10 n=1 Tax=Papilio machaon TaxID=76193 RepID=UPI001E665702|nr:neuronal acetylcholine receptor subunit alpha-10 [Papilio machaon]